MVIASSKGASMRLEAHQFGFTPPHRPAESSTLGVQSILSPKISTGFY